MSPLFSVPFKANTTKTIPLILWQLFLNYLNMMKFSYTNKLIRWMCVLIGYRCLAGQNKEREGKRKKSQRAPWMGIDFLLLQWCLFFPSSYSQTGDLDIVLHHPFVIPQCFRTCAIDRGKKKRVEATNKKQLTLIVHLLQYGHYISYLEIYYFNGP